MNYLSRRRLLQFGLLTPLAALPLSRQPSAFAVCCIDGECNNPTRITASKPVGDIPGVSNFIWPIAGAPNTPYLIGDAFGPRLIGNPGKYDWHEGIDIKADEGIDVVASCSGFVRISADCDERYKNSGKIIQIEGYEYDSNNKITQKYRINYNHLSERLVKVGDIVSQGTVIGKSGCTGANWPHLHLEIRKDDVPQNPYFYLTFPSTDSHTVAIQGVTSNANGTLNVNLRVMTPRTKLDINRINVFALDSNNNTVDSMYVDFNESHNCGRISSSSTNSYTYRESITKAVTITPENFWYDITEWTVNFTFSGLLLSNTIKIKAEALDRSGVIAEDIKTI
ncbi:peptidoglycan DD-metalloendopeptidase family protein [Scytonema sp. UIC 10036]|uniref:M23 family metallopeptidase n=1 Tax=Scytonema sp. UIC 10036 TaxID=2304196 RepID=UPI0012DA1E35|nr:M23 family metallopeptidase [Scytonema sp. UIC 10036]MUG98123.1 peptidoglycan DD-metalloendopeptidase family protein [Scytonema sp. UIC 10036]